MALIAQARCRRSQDRQRPSDQPNPRVTQQVATNAGHCSSVTTVRYDFWSGAIARRRAARVATKPAA